MTSADMSGWEPWIEQVSHALGVDAASVDVSAIHDLTRQVAQAVDRPMAPVAAYLLGLAIGRHPDRSEVDLRDALIGSVPLSR